jgi:membrane-associated phospholipid phosphatase
MGCSINVNQGLKKISHAISYILHPAVFMAGTVMVISVHIRHNILLSFRDVILLVSGLLPGLTYIFIKKRRGEFGHYHLLLKKERSIVLPMLLAGLVGSLALAAAIKTSIGIISSIIITILEGVVITVISRFWKISLHAAVAMGCAALLGSISWKYALIACILGILVGISRIVVNHHSPLQVIAGWIYGFGLTKLLMLWFKIS